MKKLLTGFSILALAFGASALQSDSSKPIEIAADHFSGDQVSQTAVYSGGVELHQGSLEMRGDRLDLQISKKGYRTGILTGRLAKFKQQRDNANPRVSEWMHAEADKLVYDEERDTITLIGNARLSRTENGALKDEASGQTIVYDMRNARSEATSGSAGGAHRRVTTVIAPRKNADQQQQDANRKDAGESVTLHPSVRIDTKKE